MRDDTVCEKCTGREGPAIIAASVLVPAFLVGVPLFAMRLERTRVYAYRLYNRWFDIGKFKVRGFVSMLLRFEVTTQLSAQVVWVNCE